MSKYDVYLYGMVLMTNCHLLNESYPEADSYSEIKESYFLPGGETGTCATVLSNFKVKVKLDGNHLGTSTYQPLVNFYSGKTVDLSSMTFDDKYKGLQDIVFVDRKTRTCFGEFQSFFKDPANGRWNKPKIEDIMQSKVVSIDPFFAEESVSVADYCKELNKKYTTIDCRFDTILHKYSEINVISNEFIRNNYKGIGIEELFKLYTQNTEGLVIFTFGSEDILYGRKGQEMKRFSPYRVNVVSTLGAGDTFKAGVTYALLNQFNDDETVRFACAASASAVRKFPLPLNPPSLEEIFALMGGEQY